MLIEQIVEASNSIAKISDDLITENLKTKVYPVYDNLAEPFRSEIIDFSKEIGIRLLDENLRSVVLDCVLSNPDILDESSRYVMKHELGTIDECMKELRKMVKREPVYYENMVPLEERIPELKELRRGQMREKHHE